MREHLAATDLPAQAEAAALWQARALAVQVAAVVAVVRIQATREDPEAVGLPVMEAILPVYPFTAPSITVVLH
jgi:sugar phosphate permease